MPINFDLNDLLSFRAVAELGSFRRAAESVHLSQPAFSRRIDKLEEALGVKLLERTTRRVTLTAIGRDFEIKTRELLNDLDATLLALRGGAATRMSEVSVACVPSTVNYFLTRVIRRFHEDNPRVRVKILDASANDVLTAVSNGEADFGINFMGTQDPGIEFKVLIEERFVAACRRDHPLARLKRVTWSQLGEYEYVAVSRSSGNRLLLDQALFNASARVNSVFETKHVNTALALVEAGLGVAAVPAMAMPTRDHPLLVGIPLVEPAVSRRLGLIKRRGRELSPAAELLYNLCMKLRHSSTGRARDAAAGR